MSLTRKIQRNIALRTGKDWPKTPQYTIYDNEEKELSGYTTLNPTKGWQRVSAKRIRAQALMLQKYGFIR